MRGRLLDKQGGRVIESGNRLPHYFVMGIFGLVKTGLALALAPSCYRLLLSLTASIEERREEIWLRVPAWERICYAAEQRNADLRTPHSRTLRKFKTWRSGDFYSRAFHSYFHLALA